MEKEVKEMEKRGERERKKNGYKMLELENCFIVGAPNEKMPL